MVLGKYVCGMTGILKINLIMEVILYYAKELGIYLENDVQVLRKFN